MHRLHLLLLGLVALSCAVGCRNACQSHLDYTGPLPAEPSDFLFRKNSILGGDPSKPPLKTGPIEPAPEEEVPPGLVGEDLQEEAAPEPAPAPDLDDFDLEVPDRGGESMPDSMSPGDADIEGQPSESESESADEPQAQLDWHAPRPR